MVELVSDLSSVEDIIKKDPVRPHISAITRLRPGRSIYHLDHKAYICLAYTNKVPSTEKQMLESSVGPMVVAYTVWSLEKGYGRKIILALNDLIYDTERFHRFVTLSPKTEMAMRFHLSNGAILLRENELTNNFEYKF